MKNKIEPFKKKIWLASPTMHGDEQKWVKDAFDKNWITTAGENINEVERQMAEYIGVNHAVALSCGTAALHLAIRLAGEKLYGIPKVGQGSLEGKNVTASENNESNLHKYRQEYSLFRYSKMHEFSGYFYARC